MVGVLSLFFWSVALQIITCPAPSSEGAYVSSNLKIYATVGTELAPVRKPQKLVATASRREGVYNRTGEPSVIFAEKEELRSE